MEQHEVFAAVLNWQANNYVHPLTCGNCEPPERDYFPLVPWVSAAGRVVLRCPLNCGYSQDYIPTPVLMAKIKQGPPLFNESGEGIYSLPQLRPPEPPSE